MIKFFRHIRHRMVNDPPERPPEPIRAGTFSVRAGNRVSKYLLYAIGEIVLVVIGILITLNINNWHEARKIVKGTRSFRKAVMRWMLPTSLRVFIICMYPR